MGELLDFEDFFFLGAGGLVDFVHVGVSQLLDFVVRPLVLVFGDLLILEKRFDGLVAVAADIAHRYAMVLRDAVQALDKFLAAVSYTHLDVYKRQAIGKRYKLPIWQILGGKYRDHVRMYADCHAGEALESITPLLVPRDPQWMRAAGDAERRSLVSLKHHGWDASGGDRLTPEAYGRRAREMAARGFRILKFDVDVPTPYETDEYNRDLSHPEIEHAAALVAGAREAVGMDVGLAIDCHWNYGVQAAIGLARALEKYKLLWLEDPTPPENIGALGVVQRNTSLPVATGENHYFRLDFERLMVDAGLRVLAPDVQKVGLWEGRKIADLADMHYVNLACLLYTSQRLAAHVPIAL